MIALCRHGGVGERGEHGRRADDEREAPDAGEQHGGEAARAPPRVVQRAGDGEVAVERDDAQVEYGRRAQQHVRRRPQQAHETAERPPAGKN